VREEIDQRQLEELKKIQQLFRREMSTQPGKTGHLLFE